MNSHRIVWYHYWYHIDVGLGERWTGFPKTLAEMHRNPKNIRYADLKSVYSHFFGNPRQESSSHAVYKMPWRGDPRINIQNNSGKAKEYRVKQALQAIDRLENGE